jgi:hypothetical protein
MTECTWCGHRGKQVPGTHAVLFACPREHMSARPLCEPCADKAAAESIFACTECLAAGVPEDVARCTVELVAPRQEWLRYVQAGRVRFCRPQPQEAGT